MSSSFFNRKFLKLNFASTGANSFQNLWKRSRGGAFSTDEDDDQSGCFQRGMPGKLYTTEEYQIETTVLQSSSRVDVTNRV